MLALNVLSVVSHGARFNKALLSKGDHMNLKILLNIAIIIAVTYVGVIVHLDLVEMSAGVFVYAINVWFFSFIYSVIMIN